jgi:putative heme-binding domain-containing protein
VEIKGDSAIVYSIPKIWLLTDVDGDGFAEKREPLYTGFGYTDTHGGASSFIYWIDGWIYGTHGFKNHSEVRDRAGHVTVVDSGNTYRFRPDGSAFEIYAHGQTNPFGLAFDPLGNLFSADSHSKPVYMLLRGGYYEGIGKQHDGLGFAPRITDDDHGSSAIAGIACYADDKWPEEYRGNLFNGNPVTQRINRDRLEWHGSTPQAIRRPDFLTCDDPWFRPVNLKLGPDGALYIADFYNPIIGHYEVPLTHPARDHAHGRIWRVVWRGKSEGAAGKEARLNELGTTVPQPRGTPPSSVTATFSDTEKVLSGSDKVISTPEKAKSTPDQANSVTDKVKSASEKVISGSGQGIVRDGKGFADPEKVKSGTDKGLSAPDKVISTPDKVASEADKANSRPEKTASDTTQTTAAAGLPPSGAAVAESGAAKSPSGAAKETSAPPKTIPGAEKPAAAAPTNPAAPEATPSPAETGSGGTLPLPIVPLPDLSHLDAPALIEKLADPSLEVRRLATNELVDRVGIDGAERIRVNILKSEDGLGVVAGLWALERLGLLPDELLVAAMVGDSGEPALGATRLLASRLEVGGVGLKTAAGELTALDRLNEKVHESEPAIARAAAEGLRLAPSLQNLRGLLMKWESAREDTALAYSVRLALKAQLAAPGIYAEMASREWVGNGKPDLGEVDRVRHPLFDAADREKLSEISLAVPTADSAAFLLAHLERTQLETPRAGEYLKHALLYLPTEKLDAVVKLVGQVGEAPLPRKLALATNLAEAVRQRGLTLPEEITRWGQSIVLETLGSSDDELARPAIAALREVKLDAKLEPLTKIVRDEARAEPLRVAALEAVANLPASRELLAATLADPRHFKLRKRASELLVAGGTAEILAALPTAPFELALSMAGDLLDHGDAACGELLDLMAAGQVSPRLLRNRLLESVLTRRTAALQARAAELTRDLPPEDERLGQVIAQRAKDFAAAKPDAAHGALVFQQNCAVCHRFRNAGGNVGPNLDGVAARGPARLIEDILDPNRNVDPGFYQTIVETQDGRTFAGTHLRVTPDASADPSAAVLHLTDLTGQELTLPRREIKAQTPTKLSPMPAAFEAQLAPGDFHDLLAFLLAPPP